jgi:hypothetical protein
MNLLHGKPGLGSFNAISPAGATPEFNISNTCFSRLAYGANWSATCLVFRVQFLVRGFAIAAYVVLPFPFNRHYRHNFATDFV